MRKITAAAAGLALLLAAGQAPAGQATVAVAANFTAPAKEIAAAFMAASGHVLTLGFGSSGQLHAQIRQDAPFDVFLSADDERPKKLADEGFGVPASRFTYAIGRLVLWSRSQTGVQGEATLREMRFDKIAIASPVAAPYGAAAVATMKALGLAEALKPKIVEGTSIAQAFQFVETGNAELGFVALSQTIGRGGSVWVVPERLHTPIRQDAIVLKRGEGNEAAEAFVAYLKGAEARRIVERHGYAPAPAGGPG